MYRIATSTEYVFDNKCLTYDEAVEVKNNLEKENPTCKLFIYKEQFIVYCNEAGNIDDEYFFTMDIPNEFYSLSFDIRLK